jgi:hypothetical protein
MVNHVYHLNFSFRYRRLRMKKNLLGTAATLLAIGLSGATIESALAGGSKDEPGGTGPALKITGNATATYHWFDNSPSARGEKSLGTYFAIEDSRLDFRATGRMDTGWTDQTFWDWLIGFTGDTAESRNVEENRIRLKGRWGTIMFGNTQGVENFMARGAFSIPGGTGGALDGNYKTTTTRPTGSYLSTDMVGATKYATKFTFVTPRYWGWQAGFSFTPNSEQKGEGSNGPPHNRTSTKTPPEAFDLNNVAVGLNYVNKLTEDWAVAGSFTAVFGKTKSPTGNNNLNQTDLFTAYMTAPRHRTKSYAVGATTSFHNFDLGVEWIDNGNSQQIKNAPAVLNQAARNPNLVANPNAVAYNGPLGTFNAGKSFSVAGAYTFGLNKVSLGYYYSSRRFNGSDTTANVYSIDYDRAIAPGFSVFAEGVYFGLKAKSAGVQFQNSLVQNFGSAPRASAPAAGPSSAVKGNNGKTLLLGANTKF